MTTQTTESQTEESEKSEARYITKIHLENFQDHSDTVIELESGINLITGSSDAGKSAALRALNFVLHNQPRGDAFIQLGATEARVTIQFSDGMTVQRIKGKSRNAVIINHPDWKEPIVKDNFGNKYPDDVIKALGSPPIDDEQGPISYAEQMSPLFLVSLSATELPRCLSRLTGIDDFEDAAKILASRSSAANKAANVHQQRIDAIHKNLEQYSGLDEQLDKLASLENLSDQASDIADKVKAGQALLSRYDIIMQQGKAAYAAMASAQLLANLADDLAPIIEISDRLSQGDTLRKQYESFQLQERQHLAAIAEGEAILALQSELDKLQEINATWESGMNLRDKYEEIMRKGRSANAELEAWNTKRDRALLDRESIINEMREAGIWCNTCNRPLTEDQCEVHA